MAEKTALGFTEKAETARFRFRLREVNNILFVSAIFGIIALLAVNTPYTTIIDLIVGGLLIYVCFFLLEKRPIGFCCPHCEEHISSNTPWVCGFKECNNLNVVEHSFLNSCETCAAEPKAYTCHHCGKIIFLSSDKLTANAARCLNLSIASSQTKAGDSQKDRQEQKQQREHAVAMAELDAKLGDLKKRTEEPKLKKPGEKMAEKFEQSYVESMGPREYARRKLKEVEELYKDDPVMLADAKQAIQDALNKVI